MTHAHTGSTASTQARPSRSTPIGEFRMGGTPQPMRNGSSRWFGAGLVAVLASIGGVSAYHLMFSNHQEIVSVAPLVVPQQETPPATIREQVAPIDETSPAAPAQPERTAEPPKPAAATRPANSVTTKEKAAVKAPAPLPSKPAAPVTESSPPVQAVAPVVKEPEPVKVDAPKPEAPKTDAMPATATSEVKPTTSDNPTPKATIET